jgi:hypothetical protein
MKRQKWLTGVLAAMLVASFLVAAINVVATIHAEAAGPEPNVQCPSCGSWMNHCYKCYCPSGGFCDAWCQYRWCYDNECNSYQEWRCSW